ncbi:MAG: hypothetical protein F9K47_02390 [Burkholderiales bacterium]|nr:MAG: hypothetical protein F9K47_02390 [Burkholderiales bacterium]
MFTRKQISRTTTALGLSFLLVAGALAAGNASHSHEHGAAPARLSLNQGHKWATDAALRHGMESIRSAMDASLHDIHENKLTPAKYAELAKKVDGEVAGIVAHCKLEPAADAQLHLVIAEILNGVETMQGKSKKAKRQAGAVQVVAALEQYGKFFEHAGWQGIRH